MILNIMKKILRVALTFGMVLSWCVAEAQYTFSAQIVVTGNCFSGASNIAMNNIRQIVNECNAKCKSIPLTKEECMAMSQQFSGQFTLLEFNEYGCSIKVIISPCVCTRCQEETTPGPDQGGSYNSANAGSEVSDWVDDVAARQNSIGQIPIGTQQNGTGDARFDEALRKSLGTFELPNNAVVLPDDFELLANMENVNRYLSRSYDMNKIYMEYPQDLTAMLHEEFKRISGFDLDVIRNMPSSQRSDAEKQALLDYQVYRKMMLEKMADEIWSYVYEAATSENTRVFEMAVLSETCYGDSKHENITRTNYIEVGQAFFEGKDDNDPVKGLFELIGFCNATTQETGFHAELYYNKVTGEYTVAFEGTLDWRDVKTDAVLGFNGIPEQHNLAMRIADYIKLNLLDEIKLNITGHSLGGSLASIVGLATGLPTYTYNPAGVNNAMIDKFGLRDNLNNGNIKAYQANNDPITSVQEGVLKPFVVGTVISVVYSVNPVKGNELAIESIKGNTANPAVGDKETVYSDGGHTIHSMVSWAESQSNHNTVLYKSMLDNVNQMLNTLEQQTQESILIIWSDE